MREGSLGLGEGTAGLGHDGIGTRRRFDGRRAGTSGRDGFRWRADGRDRAGTPGDGRAVWLVQGLAGVIRGRLSGWAGEEAAYGRAVLWLPVLFGFGVWTFFLLPDPPAWWITALGALAAIAGAVRLRTRPVLALSLAASAALSTGLAAISLEAAAVAAPTFERERSVVLEGWVVARETRRAGRVRYTVLVRDMEGVAPEQRPRRVRLSAREGQTPVAVGDAIAVTGRLGPLRGPVQPGGYDSARRLWFDGIGATGFAYGAPRPIVRDDPPPFLLVRAAVDRLRTGIAERIRAARPGASGEVAAALLVGARGGIPPDTTEDLRTAGLGHVLAISGLHMALVAGTVFAAARFVLVLVPGFVLRHPVKKYAAIVGLAAGTIYLVLSGASVATERAYVMLVIALAAILFGRPAISMRNVALAALVVMAIDPVVVLQPGFQMSFAAVVALVAAYERFSLRLSDGPEVARPPAISLARLIVFTILGLAATSIVAGLATTPISAFHFQRLAPFGLLGNLLAMPIVTFIVMPAGVVALAVMPLGLETVPLQVMGIGLDVVIAIAAWVASLTSGGGVVGSVSGAATLLAMAGLGWLALWISPIRWLGVPAITAGLALMPLAPRADLLVSDDGRTIAARAPDGRLAVRIEGGGDFAAAMWLKADGDVRPVGVAEDAHTIACDGAGCVLSLGLGGLGGLGADRIAVADVAVIEIVSDHPAIPSGVRHRAVGEGFAVAIADSPSALLEDCDRAAVVVTRGYLAACPDPLLAIDRLVLQQTGAIAVDMKLISAMEEGTSGLRLTVRTSRPENPRPWQVAPSVRF